MQCSKVIVRIKPTRRHKKDLAFDAKLLADCISGSQLLLTDRQGNFEGLLRVEIAWPTEAQLPAQR
jgi:hypothetical protein